MMMIIIIIIIVIIINHLQCHLHHSRQVFLPAVLYKLKFGVIEWFLLNWQTQKFQTARHLNPKKQFTNSLHLYINHITDNIQLHCYWLCGFFFISSVIKRRVAVYSIEYFLSISGTELIFLKTLESVISSGEMLEGSVVLKSTW